MNDPTRRYTLRDTSVGPRSKSGVRLAANSDGIEVYTVRRNYGVVSDIHLSRAEALELARIINAEYILDALGQI